MYQIVPCDIAVVDTLSVNIHTVVAVVQVAGL